MAQLAAHLLCKQGVTGSSPVGSTLVRRYFVSRTLLIQREYSSKVQQCSRGIAAFELLTEALQGLQCGVARYLAVDIHSHRDLTVAEDLHGDTRVYVQCNQ